MEEGRWGQIGTEWRTFCWIIHGGASAKSLQRGGLLGSDVWLTYVSYVEAAELKRHYGLTGVPPHASGVTLK